MKRRTNARINGLIRRAENLVKEGMSVADACAKVNINTSLWYSRKRAQEAKKMPAPKAAATRRRPLTIETESAPVAEKMTVIMGTPEQIREVLRG